MVFNIGKLNDGFVIGKPDTLRPSLKMTMPQPLLTTSKPVDITSSGISLIFWRRAKPTTIIHRMQIWRTTRSSPGTSHESEASEASVFCFDSAFPEKSCFVDGLVCFISLCLRVFEFLNATRRE